ncbi:hypothetical protein E3P92_02210 [Wallemia ichthyophaga]|nr:hypothetical protein E3P91_01961 [Wallemia ichthyophaga]TIA80099.1 hypothetical protein E3P98_02881 [Wallemia ichthyophaga]TIB13664.1 hypothetical protein E3P92_02210 [Wallemia ichthyophaga]TIB32091.1 hypothetical protein E3P84_02711 [Wallemia ichthyophaga]TIB40773.1 hypothetical protein E3P83_02648 [Wallemia ichthyophaga]
MGRITKKNEKGAVKNYMTRNQAIKKLQISLADFRRLCILKGIFPREPRNKKKANKGSTAPKAFYYTKDIVYLQHEPLLNSLREYKSFAKKISKLIGRNELVQAKAIEDNQKPEYRLDHIIRERYPTFQSTLNDLPDAISLIMLFSHLPANSRIPADIIDNCAKLSAQWQLYVMRTKSLRKIFLSIKGVYFEAEVEGRPIRWLVPYMFTQHIPEDVDFRILMTFLELYQTLTGFVFYKLYNDINLVYPPPLDIDKDGTGAGIGAFNLREASGALTKSGEDDVAESAKVSAKDVRKQINQIGQTAAPPADDQLEEQENVQDDQQGLPAPEEFVEQPSKNVEASTDIGQSLNTLLANSKFESARANLFAPYTFYLSREVTRPTLEFVIRSFGGQVGWDMTTLGGGSPVPDETDARITHMVVDRPHLPARLKELNLKRAYIQPQWIVDSANAGRLLPTEPYAPGETLPPHMSPFEVADEEAYVPGLEIEEKEAAEDEEEGEEDEDVQDEDMQEDEEEKEQAQEAPKSKYPTEALIAAAQNPNDESLHDAAELEAEQLGISHDVFEAELKKAKKSSKSSKKQNTSGGKEKEDDDMAHLMMGSKQRKLYNKVKHSQKRQTDEHALLESKKKDIKKKQQKDKKKKSQHELDIQAIRKQLIQTMCPNNSSSNNNNSTPLSTPKLKSSQLSNSSNGGGVERRGSIMLEDSYDGGSLLFASNPSASKPVSTSASSGS